MRANLQAQNRAALPNLPDIRRIAENMEQYFGRETGSTGVYRWVRELTEKADPVVKPMQVATAGVWVADEVAVNVEGKKYWLFNVMDSDTRLVLAAYLSPARTTRAAATASARETGQAYKDTCRILGRGGKLGADDRLPSKRNSTPRKPAIPSPRNAREINFSPPQATRHEAT